jgi:Heavy metal associated domain 2
LIAEIHPGIANLALVHHHPGRLRLRGPSLERSARVAVRARDALDGVYGVARVVHNETSGSLLVEYAPEAIEADAILSRIGEAGIRLERLEASPRHADAARAVAGAVRDLNGQVGGATRGVADLHGVVSFLLGIGAVVSFAIGRGPRFPRWDNLLYWSYTFFREVSASEVERPSRRPVR